MDKLSPNLLLSLLILAFACSDYPKEEQYYYKDGSLKAKITTYNKIGKRDAYNYYPNGNLNFVYRYLNYDNDGIAEWYDTLGRIVSKRELINDTVNGISKYYYPSGNLQANAETSNGVRNGWSKVYFDQMDTLTKRIIYFQADSALYDIEYDEDGQIISSYIHHVIDKKTETSDSVILILSTPYSQFSKIAVKTGEIESIYDSNQLYFDNKEYVEIGLFKNDKRRVEGLILEVSDVKYTFDSNGDSLAILSYEAEYPFKYKY